MRKRLRAVALVTANVAGEILILQEFVSKPDLGKYEGMFSIPMETCHQGEPDLLALKRLHDEELTGLPFMGEPDYIGAYRVAPHVWAKLYSTKIDSTPTIIGHTLEVGNHQWMPVEKAKALWLRRGALDMIEDYVSKVRPVIRRTCREVQKEVRT